MDRDDKYRVDEILGAPESLLVVGNRICLPDEKKGSFCASGRLFSGDHSGVFFAFPLRILGWNPVQEAPVFVDDFPVTTKGDQRYHGFGLRSIRHFVRKYDGYLNISVEDGCFSLKIMMPIA